MKVQNDRERRDRGLVQWFLTHLTAKKLIAGALAFVMILSVVTVGWQNAVEARAREAAQAAAAEQAAAEQASAEQVAAEQITAEQTSPTVRVNAPVKSTEDPFARSVEKANEAIAAGEYEDALMLAETSMELAQDDEQRALAGAILGNTLFYLERYEESEAYYRKILAVPRENFTDGELLNMIARCRLLKGDSQGAHDICTEGINAADKTDKALPELYALRGTAQMALGRYQQAVKDFQNAIDSGYENKSILYEQISQCEYLQNNYQAAISSAEKAGDGPDELLALSYYVSGNYAKAVAAYEALLASGSSNFTDAQLYSSLAKCQVLLQRYDAAVKSCNSGLRKNETSENPTLYALRGSAYMALSDYLAAAQDFDAAVASGYSDVKIISTQAAVCYYFTGHYEDAIRAGKAATTVPQEDTEAVLWTALSYYMLQDFENTIVWLTRALPIEQSYCEPAELYRILARSCLLTERYEQCLEATDAGKVAFGSAAAADPGILGELYALAGTALLSTGQYETALTEFLTAVDSGYTSLYEVYKQCLLCSFLSGKYEDAVNYAELALKNGEGTADLYYWLGLSCFSLERYAEARDALLQAKELEDTQENLYFYLGVCRFSLEEYEAAVEEFTASIEHAEPAAARSLYNRGLCWLQMEDYSKAKEDLTAAEQAGDETVADDASKLLKELQKVL